MTESEKPISVLFVCTRNRLRSQMAVGFAVQAVEEGGLSDLFIFSSAGLNPGAKLLEDNEPFLNTDGRMWRELTRKAQELAEPAIKNLQSFGITFALQTPRRLTPELLVENNYVFCFTDRQLSECNKLAKKAEGMYPDAAKSRVDLLTGYVGLKGGITDPDKLIATKAGRVVREVLTIGTIMNCLHAREYGLARQVIIDSLFGRDVSKKLVSYQVRKIQYCVGLAIDKMLTDAQVNKGGLIGQTS